MRGDMRRLAGGLLPGGDAVSGSVTVFRIQDEAGRGPFKTGFSRVWLRDRPDHENLRPWTEQFKVHDILFRAGGLHVGCACRTVDQLRRWFTLDEYLPLLICGYDAVSLDADRVLGESDIQIVFARRRRLSDGAVPFALYGEAYHTPIPGTKHSGRP